MRIDSTEPLTPQDFTMLHLERNLMALAQNQPKMVQRISWPVDGSHVVFGEDGRILYRLHSATYPLSLSSEETNAALGRVVDGKDILVFGIGIGEHVDLLLESFPRNRIVAWEKDPWLLRLLLMRKDYSPFLESGRLRLSLGTDLIFQTSKSNSFTFVHHPLLKDVYRNEANLIASGISERRVVIHDGDLLVEDVAAAFRNLGYTPFFLNLEALSIEEIEFSIIQFSPQILFSINYRNGLSELASRFNVTLLCWEIDHATDTLPPLLEKSERAYVFTYRKKNVDEFKRAGFNHTEFLPLAADTEARRPISLCGKERENYSASVSFVGSSLMEQRSAYMSTLNTLFKEYCTECGIPLEQEDDPFGGILRRQAEDFSQYLLPQWFHESFPGFADFFRKKTMSAIEPLNLLAEVAAAEKRRLYISGLAKFGVKVWGDAAWNSSVSDCGVCYMGPAGHKHDLNKIYTASLINLDVNRLYQMDMVNMRVFDILACGGFVLAEISDDLNELFEVGREVIGYRTLEELEEKVGYYLSRPEEARAIAERGMAAVRERHTVRQRIEYMLSVAGGPRAISTVTAA